MRTSFHRSITAKLYAEGLEVYDIIQLLGIVQSAAQGSVQQFKLQRNVDEHSKTGRFRPADSLRMTEQLPKMTRLFLVTASQSARSKYVRQSQYLTDQSEKVRTTGPWSAVSLTSLDRPTETLINTH
uniref:Uncharacterized protein n=1 Tax=Caenorhabditis japonica TaxID=281687 RepID=A0A8R1EL51_CAEJA